MSDSGTFKMMTSLFIIIEIGFNLLSTALHVDNVPSVVAHLYIYEVLHYMLTVCDLIPSIMTHLYIKINIFRLACRL